MTKYIPKTMDITDCLVLMTKYIPKTMDMTD